MLTLNNITVQFSDKKVIDNLSLTFNRGEIIGLVAPNGTGKSTLLNVIMNFLRPNSGNVVYKTNYNYKNKRNEVKMHQLISSFPEQSDLYPELSGFDHLMIFAKIWGNSNEIVESVIEQLEMSDYVTKKTKTYSLGMKQRLCFAMQLVTDTEVMLMDEVMNGLDPNNMALISSVLIELRRKNKLIIIASHLLENLESYADRVLFLDQGKIIYERHQKQPKAEELYLRSTLSTKQKSELLEQLADLNLTVVDFSTDRTCIKIPNGNPDIIEDVVNELMYQEATDFEYGKMTLNELYAYYYLTPNRKSQN